MSFIVRTLTANRITTGRISTWLGFRMPARLRPDQVRQLAWICNVSAPWLRYRMVQVDHNLGRDVWQYLGQSFLPGAWIRDLQSPICPDCVHERGLCRAAWTVAGVCACPIHGTALIDRCQRCGIAISWDRPAVDVCKCQFPFCRASIAQAHGCSIASAWSTWISARLDGGAMAAQGPIAWLPSWVQELSVDGACRVVHAFGAYTSPLQRMPASCTTRLLAPAEVCSIVERGLERIQRFDGSVSGRAALADLIHVQGLMRLARRGLSVKDRAIVAQVASALSPAAISSRGGRRPNARGQLDLFPSGLDNA